MSDRRVSRPDLTSVRPERLAELFIDVSKQLGRTSSRARTGELSNARYNVMRAVLHRGPERMSRIAAVVGISPRSLTDLVDALAHDGYLRRVADPHDRRSVLIELTASASTPPIGPLWKSSCSSSPFPSLPSWPSNGRYDAPAPRPSRHRTHCLTNDRS
jgi:DNA-binding MarR family transcriptional regulator